MPSPRVFLCTIEGMHRLFSWPPYIALAAALTACSTPPQSRPAAPEGSSAAQVSLAEKCSMVAEMACKAVSLLSGGGAPTCTAFTADNGMLVERCGTAEAEPASSAGARNMQTSSQPATLSWTDNADNESGFIIERCGEIRFSETGENRLPACAGEWILLASVSANTTTYVDHTAEPNKTYIYRVKAINSLGSSGYSNQALITIPSR